jgi:fructokinase
VSEAQPGVVVVGDVLVDVLVAAAGSRSRRPGGAGLNLALSLRQLGVRSTLAAPLARDADGDWLRTVAGQGGVDVLALPHPGRTGVATSRRVAGEPVYAFSDSVLNRAYRWDSLAAERVSAGGRVLVVNSFPMHDPEQVAALAGLLERTGQRFVVDPNARPVLMTDVDAYRAGFRRLARAAEVVKLSTQDVAELGIADPDQLIGELFADGVQVVLLTRGAAGATVLTPAGLAVDVPVPARSGPVIDTMGAGDATLAVLVAGITREGIELTADRWRQLATDAMEVAADVCRQPGGSLPPS